MFYKNVFWLSPEMNNAREPGTRALASYLNIRQSTLYEQQNLVNNDKVASQNIKLIKPVLSAPPECITCTCSYDKEL